MDARFSSAVHALILISESETPMSSQQIAHSVGTNASYIRKLTSLLKKKGIIQSRQGAAGFRLNVAPEQLTLYQIYQSIYETDRVHLFDLHRNPNDECIVGQHIRPVLEDTFADIERKAYQEMQKTTLRDCMDKMRKEIEKEA